MRRHHSIGKIILGLVIVLSLVGLGVYHVEQGQTANFKATPFHHHPVTYVNHHDAEPLLGKSDLVKARPHLKTNQESLVMDARTGQVLYAHHIHRSCRVASIAKTMTLYLVERKVQRTHDGWNQVVKAANNRQLRKIGNSKVDGGFKFKPGHRYTVKDLFRAALIRSSNNAAIALGEWVAGDKNPQKANRHFVQMMNQQAQAWKINAHFISASGLENDDLDKYGLHVAGGRHAANKLTPVAVAIIAQHLIKEYPNVLQTSRIDNLKVDGQKIHNPDNMLPGKTYAKKGLKVDGLKTGFTPKAGMCFVGTEKPYKHRDRIITVVLNDPAEFGDTGTLMKFIYQYSKVLQ